MDARPLPFARNVLVSRCGRVVSAGRDLTPQTVDGYPTVIFRTVLGTRKSAPVHRLVALVWLDPPPDGQTHVRHRDGDRSNAHADNLAWGSPAMNAQDRADHGRTARGERHGRALVTAADVVAIRTAFDGGATLAQIAGQYAIRRSAVQAITSRRTWRHVA